MPANIVGCDEVREIGFFLFLKVGGEGLLENFSAPIRSSLYLGTSPRTPGRGFFYSLPPRQANCFSASLHGGMRDATI